ncbi:MAG TPA: hypothetical protein VMR74_12180 [Gammaproteobacteria bacterium]|nr:hypothetical protein [Gammaproteobacteria bacterium]
MRRNVASFWRPSINPAKKSERDAISLRAVSVCRIAWYPKMSASASVRFNLIESAARTGRISRYALLYVSAVRVETAHLAVVLFQRFEVRFGNDSRLA